MRFFAFLPVAFCASPFTLYLLDANTYPLAKCLDGSQPGYYHSAGWGSGSDSWVIHTQGGGWCNSDSDCAGRAKSPLGSSTSWGKSGCDASTRTSSPVCYADGGDSGMISNSSATNPLLYNWNKVRACCMYGMVFVYYKGDGPNVLFATPSPPPPCLLM